MVITGGDLVNETKTVVAVVVVVVVN